MSQPLLELEPSLLWKHFADICAIPHPSKKEEAIRAHVLAWAEKNGFATTVDAAGNVVVRVPATAGHENAPTVVIQGHLDMVCEKNRDVAKDFDKDPIDAYVDGEWVTARGTTLGADNGIGVAAGMAAAEDPNVVHGPLELLCTVDEETGLTGASALQPGFVSGTMLLNLDSEEDGTFYAGCAGGGDAHLHLPLTRTAPPAGATGVRVKVLGLRGGHSGLNIHENRGNALKLLARVLRKALEQGSFGLVCFEGGDKHNAIPREAVAELYVTADARPALEAAVAGIEKDGKTEFGGIDPDLAIAIEEADLGGSKPLDEASRDRFLDFLLAVPHGVIAMSRDIAGLVETSTNLASVRTTETEAAALTSTRSSVAPAIAAVRAQISACTRLAGGRAELEEGYPGWQPNMDSPLLKAARTVFEETFGKPAHVTAIHAGLECGIIGERYPQMDMLSFGPEIQGAHSPDERLHIASTQRFWTFLKAMLAHLA